MYERVTLDVSLNRGSDSVTSVSNVIGNGFAGLVQRICDVKARTTRHSMTAASPVGRAKTTRTR